MVEYVLVIILEFSSCIKTICGLGGCGKTSLAIEFAWRYKHRFPGGVFWVNGESNEKLTTEIRGRNTYVCQYQRLSNRPHRGHFEQIAVIVVQNETSMASFDRQCR